MFGGKRGERDGKESGRSVLEEMAGGALYTVHTVSLNRFDTNIQYSIGRRGKSTTRPTPQGAVKSASLTPRSVLTLRRVAPVVGVHVSARNGFKFK